MNLETTQNINLDFYKTKMITVDAKQYDKSSRYLLISCYNQGTFFKFNNSSHSIYVRYKKPDEYPVFNSCSITDDGNILIELTEQMLSVPGICSADLIIINKSNISSDKEATITDDNDLKNILSTMKFYVNVIPTPFQNSEIESSYEFNALNDLLIKANEDYTYIINTVTSIAETTKNYKTDAENYSLQSKSYAVGTKDEIRENDSVDNAKYYYEQAKRIAQGLEGSLLPMGTIPFSQISTILKQPGYMYNISDDFITDDTFKEGSGHSYSAGTNIYYTADGYWDCLAGTNVSGIKGNAESEYRTGLVNITKEDIGIEKVDNTSDIEKPVSTLQQEEFDKKVNKTGDTITGNLFLKNGYSIHSAHGGMQPSGYIKFMKIKLIDNNANMPIVFETSMRNNPKVQRTTLMFSNSILGNYSIESFQYDILSNDIYVYGDLAENTFDFYIKKTNTNDYISLLSFKTDWYYMKDKILLELLDEYVDALPDGGIKATLDFSKYPIGSIYKSIDPTNPSQLFGGTWTAWGAGRVAVGVDTTQTEFNTVGKTGGEKTHTLTVGELAPHTHIQNAHSHSPSGYTSSNQLQFSGYLGGSGAERSKVAMSSSGRYALVGKDGATSADASGIRLLGGATNSATATNQNTGGGSAHNNLPPYITCYMWLRTA